MIRFFIILLSLITIISGCGQQAQDTNENANPDHVVKVNDPNGDQKHEQKSGEEIAQHLVELSSSIPNVEDATAVVLGQYAVVGIDVNSELDRSRVGSIKYSVAESLQHDPYGANAVVVADPDTVSRLRGMAEQIRQGHPVEGIMEELSGIVGRMMPQIPSDIKSDTEAPTEQNENQMPNDQELDQIQNDQSKGRLN